jgi:hypothetical protein
MIAMEPPTLVVDSPWDYRSLVPWCAWWLSQYGIHLDVAFFAITFLSLLGGAWLLKDTLGELAGWLYLATMTLTGYNLTNFWLVDPASHFLIILGVYALQRGNFALVLGALTLGVLCKETCWLIWIFAIAKWWNKDEWHKIFLLPTLPFLIFAGWRAYGGNLGGYDWQLICSHLEFYRDSIMIWHTFTLLWVFGVLWFIYRDGKWSRPWILACIPVLALLFVPLRMITTDVHRVAATLFFLPLLSVANASLCKWLNSKHDWLRLLAIVFLILYVLINVGIVRVVPL